VTDHELAPSFESLLALEREGDRFRTHVPASWTQGRTVFGGLVAAIGVRAMQRTLPTPRPLVALDVNFVAPIPAGEVQVRVELLREGRNVTQARADILVADAVASTLLATFAVPRPQSAVRVAPPPPVVTTPPEEGLVLPFVKGIAPEFTRFFEFTYSEGDLPFTGSSRATMGGLIRHRTHATGIEAVLGLVDAWPAPVIPMCRGFTPASTMRWTLHVLDEVPDDLSSPGNVPFFRSEALAATQGYATTMGWLHVGGRALVWSEQLVAVFDG
jgi:acyl-coenzyme A thioesterase PaaI-like protein